LNALDWLDRAFALARRGGGALGWRAWLAGAPLVFLVVFSFYLERVEGVHSFRGVLALGLGLAWWWRTHMLGRACRLALADLAEELPPPPDAYGTLGLSGVAGVTLAFALLPAAALARGGAFGVIIGASFAVPVGLLAPSWLALAGVDRQGGIQAFLTAFRDASTLRGSALLVQGFLLAGTLLLFANLLAVAGMLLAAVQGLLGVEVAALESFMSFDNDFAMLVMGAIALWIAEPLRVALATVALLHARSRRDGADLRRMLSGLSSTAPVGGRANARADQGRAALVLLFLTFALQSARAQVPEVVPDSAEAPAAETYFPPELPTLAPQDQAIEDEVATILSGSEFSEGSDSTGDSNEAGEGPSWLKRLLDAIARWLEDREESEATSADRAPPMPLPPAWVFVALAVALLVAVAAFLIISRRREEQALPSAPDGLGGGLDPRERAPQEHLDEAAQLAARGLHREAFRSLYLATLVALDRRGEIDFDPARTNWHYLRQMGASARAIGFRTFTQLFDRKWYGEEHTTREEYERGRTLATSLAAPRTDAARPPETDGAVS